MHIYVDVLQSSAYKELRIPIFFFRQSDFNPSAYESLAIAVINSTLTPSLVRFSAIFLPTPPKDILIFPGLESAFINLLYGVAQMSKLAPPITQT